jgi:hypothetical protein
MIAPVLVTLSLRLTPLRRLTGWYAPISILRSVGALGFLYIVIHFTIFWLFDVVCEDDLLAVSAPADRFACVHERASRRVDEIGIADADVLQEVLASSASSSDEGPRQSTAPPMAAACCAGMRRNWRMPCVRVVRQPTKAWAEKTSKCPAGGAEVAQCP